MFAYGECCMWMSGLAWRDHNRSTLSCWNLLCFLKLQYHIETLCASVAIVSLWLINLFMATVQQCSQVQIFMLSFAIRNERAMYWHFCWMFQAWWWLLSSSWLSGIRLWIHGRYPELELFACLSISIYFVIEFRVDSFGRGLISLLASGESHYLFLLLDVARCCCWVEWMIVTGVMMTQMMKPLSGWCCSVPSRKLRTKNSR